MPFTIPANQYVCNEWAEPGYLCSLWCICKFIWVTWASQMVLVVKKKKKKNPPASAGDIRNAGSIPGSGRSPGGGHGNPLQSSCLENPMARGAWGATVHGVTKSRTGQKRLSMHAGGSFIFFIIEHLLCTRHCSKSFSSKVVNKTVQNPKHNGVCIPNENKSGIYFVITWWYILQRKQSRVGE